MTPARKRAAAEFGRTLLAIAVGLLIGAIAVLVVSKEPLKVYQAVLTGSFPTLVEKDGVWVWRGMNRFGSFLEDFITLSLLGLAVAIPFKARQFSLGADGQIFMGALASAAVSIYLPLPGLVLIPLAFFAAAAAGFVWGWLPGQMKARAGASEIVTTLLLNVIAVQVFSWLLLNVMRDPGADFITSYPFSPAAVLTPLIERTHVSVMVFVAPVLCFAGALFLQRTTLGFEIRTVGVNPSFAAQTGMPVARAIALSMALGGAAAGIAGFHIANAILLALPQEFPLGLGFEGIVVALLARNDPRLVVPAAAFYAWLRNGAQIMERTTDVNREMVLVVQAIIILLVVSESLLPRLSRWLGRRAV